MADEIRFFCFSDESQKYKQLLSETTTLFLLNENWTVFKSFDDGFDIILKKVHIVTDKVDL